MNVTQALKNAENSLRDFISYVLVDAIGDDWEQKCGVSLERLEKWKERKEIEEKRQKSGAIDERILYYADFYDLKTILKKQWHHFANALGEYKTFEVWLSELERFRDPDAHRRELLPHQKNLIVGISGEIRTKIAKYRSSLETSDAYYPRIEFASDNLGNSWKPGQDEWLMTRLVLRPGDIIEHTVTATDPLEESLLYQCTYNQGHPGHSDVWSEENEFTYQITNDDVGHSFYVDINVKTNRKYHARGSYDCMVSFNYEVLPPKDL